MDQPLLKRLEEEITAKLGDPSFGAKELSRIFGMSPSSLLRKVKDATGKTINQLIREMRLQKSLELLQEGSASVSQVAHLSGFTSQAYFTACFRKHFGYTPGAVEANHFSVSPNKNPIPEVKNRTSRQPFRLVILVFSIGIILIASVLIFLAATGRFSKEISIAVLPFRSNSLSAEDAEYTEFLWEQVITTLGQIEVFDVKSPLSSGQYRDTSGKSIRQIGRELRVTYIIEGSVSRDGDQFQFALQLIDAKKDDHSKVGTYIFTMSSLHESMLDIAEHTAFKLKTVLKPGEKSAILLRCSRSTESMENLLVGRSLMNFEQGIHPAKALPYYRKAILLDSTWITPHVEIVTALEMLIIDEPKEEYIKERFKSIKKAQEISPGLMTYISWLRYYLDTWDLKNTRKYHKKAIKEYPDIPTTNFYMGKASRNLGRWKEAEQMLLNLYLELPDNVQVNLGLGETYEKMRDFPQAMKYYKQGMSINPGFSIFYYGLADISLKWKGDTREATELLEKEIKKMVQGSRNILQDRALLILANIYKGDFEEALMELSLWKEGVPFGPPPYYHPKYLYYAWVYGCMGNQDLERVYYDSTRIFIEDKVNEWPELGKRPAVISCLGMAYAGLGDNLTAIEKAERVKEILSANQDHFRGPSVMEDVAWIYTKTGDYHQALKIIKKLLSNPGPLTTKLLEIDPKWAALKDQPQYKRLIDKYSIPIVKVSEVVPETDKKFKAPEIKGPSFTDERDGNLYRYNQIGTQTWMAQNLAYLPAVSPPDTGAYTEKYYYVYGYDGDSVTEAKETANYAVYGVLYNWEAALSACPIGWHLPSDEEWQRLENYLGMKESEADSTGKRESGSVGKKLKYTEGWNRKGGGDNSCGFYALPAGGRYFGKIFYELGNLTDMWTSTAVDVQSVWFRDLNSEYDGVLRKWFDKRNGFSVRCIKD